MHFCSAIQRDKQSCSHGCKALSQLILWQIRQRIQAASNRLHRPAKRTYHWQKSVKKGDQL
jgi:hypothetical protein